MPTKRGDGQTGLPRRRDPCKAVNSTPDLRDGKTWTEAAEMKPALLVMTFVTPGGGETHWSEVADSVAVCHGRAISLAEWAASYGIEVRYGCRSTLAADKAGAKEG